jgi:two-component system OmpR family response regulator
MIVDDDDEFGELMQRTLQRVGFDTFFQRGPFGTIGALMHGKFDLVILDVMMPGLDGQKMVELIRETKAISKIKVLLCSSLDPDKLRDLASRLSVSAVISKSATKDEFIAMVNGLLREGRAP